MSDCGVSKQLATCTRASTLTVAASCPMVESDVRGSPVHVALVNLRQSV